MMQSSFIDRIFPQPSRSPLPQYERREPDRVRKPRSPAFPPVRSIGDATTSHRSSSGSSLKHDGTLRSTPLGASLVHHDDPFLPIERAARALQDTIQSFLDTQSYALTLQINGNVHDELQSIGSMTPTQSVVSQQTSPGIRVVPVRQPARGKVSLKNARKGLSKSMRRFAQLRHEEIKLLEVETKQREDAMQRITDLQHRRNALQAEVESIKNAEPSKAAASLRLEARNVHDEIRELEHRVLELKVRHRHLLNQATQIESSLDSKASSYKNSLATIDNEIAYFLKRPPVHNALGIVAASANSGMYAFTPERRTLTMAQEQWSSELNTLNERKLELENEQNALVEGGRMWSDALTRINNFEQLLRKHTKQLAQSHPEQPLNFSFSENNTPSRDRSEMSMQQIFDGLNDVTESLETDLSTAEERHWNLLIAALGAEIEALRQARDILYDTHNRRDDHLDSLDPQHTKTNGSLLDEAITASTRSASQRERQKSFDGSEASNQSLKDTLVQFGEHSDNGALHDQGRGFAQGSESEDDEPPKDFLVSS